MYRNKRPFSRPRVLIAVASLLLAVVLTSPSLSSFDGSAHALVDARAIAKRSPGGGADTESVHRDPHTPYVPTQPGGGLQTGGLRRKRHIAKRSLFPYLSQDHLPADDDEPWGEAAGRESAVPEDQVDELDDNEQNYWQQRLSVDADVYSGDDDNLEDAEEDQVGYDGYIQILIEPQLNSQDLFENEEEEMEGVLEDGEVGLEEEEDNDEQDSDDYDHLWQKNGRPSRVRIGMGLGLGRSTGDMGRERDHVKGKPWIVEEWEEDLDKSARELEHLLDWVEDVKHTRADSAAMDCPEPRNSAAKLDGHGDSFRRLLPSKSWSF
ncbi:hypothetical protein BGZ99_004415 [Dissophora globulifera]|uniref:Uncharacterized protein n=1 Tax=Dissophora globulifera TaxID=979702 RepID=A0A9P6UV42_9FUNG|nr:hypothetical protein BGZ99_004415 [Dissophora globulifera]